MTDCNITYLYSKKYLEFKVLIMKSDNIIKLMTFSDIRTNILLQLLETPSSLTDLKDILKITSANISPRIRELEKGNLISKRGNHYCLSPIGAILTKKLCSMISLSMLLEEKASYFDDHDLEPIPPCMLSRIEEIRKSEVIHNTLENTTAIDDLIFDNLLKSKSVKVILPIFNQHYLDIFSSIARKNLPVTIILTERISKVVEKNFNDQLVCFKSNNVDLFVINDVKLALIVTDSFLSLSLFGKNTYIYNQSNLVSSDRSSLNWGDELFEHYIRKAEKIKL